MLKIVALPGSLRQKSFNRALLAAALDQFPAGYETELVSFRDFPIYDGDLEERRGIPESVARLKEKLAAADGLLLASPEYNNSLPGPLKNAIDWLSRPAADAGRVFGDLAVGLMGVTPGRGGTRFAHNAWLPVFRALGVRPFFGSGLFVDGAGSLFDDQRRLTDEGTSKRVAKYVAGFAEFVRQNAEPRRARRGGGKD